ncbi:MAG: macro domain-containing protein [Lachnospiraceae bacterium]|nr:macro domain-containing protein [Lachnospiraceae bacterium]
MPFQIIRNDITKVKADAIVNTANPEAIVGAGVEKVIYNAAGEKELLDARKMIGVLKPGEVNITSAFKLDAKYIIHVSGPLWKDGNSGETDILRSCYDKALKLAIDNKCESIAFPLLSTGTYGFPKEIGIQIAIDAFTHFLEEYEINITLVVFEDEAVKVSGKLVEEVASYIDDGYVEDALADEYKDDSIQRFHFIGSNISRIIEPLSVSRRKKDSAPEEPVRAAKSFEAKESLDDTLKGIYKDSFGKHLQKVINKKGLKNSEVYAAANISKQYFSKLLNGKVNPSKGKVLALAVGLRLNLDEAIDFLGVAGYALSPISQTDIIVKYFIENEDYSVIKIDIVLFDYGLEPLSKA